MKNSAGFVGWLSFEQKYPYDFYIGALTLLDFIMGTCRLGDREGLIMGFLVLLILLGELNNEKVT